MDYKDFDIHLLSSNDNVDSFNCGNEDLNEFIQNDAVNYFDQRLAYNYVMQKADQTIAYFSLANDRIAIDDFESKTHFNRFRRRHFVNSKRIKTYPAAKLCRFAVDSKYRGKRIGSSLLNMIKFTLSKESQTACRFLIVDAYREAFAFYIKNGFTPLRECDQIEGPTIPMYFDLFDIS